MFISSYLPCSLAEVVLRHSTPFLSCGSPTLSSSTCCSHRKSYGIPYMSHTCRQWSQLLMYDAGGSDSRLIRRVWYSFPLSTLLGSFSVTTFRGLCRVQNLLLKGACANHEGRQCSVELSLKLVRTRRSCCTRLSCWLQSTRV